MSKAIQIPEETYAGLARAKEHTIQWAKEKGEKEFAEALSAMSVEAFVCWLLLKELEKLKGDDGQT